MMVYHLFALLPVAAAVALPRAQISTAGFVPPNMCCFTLHDSSSGQIVKQTKEDGYLTLAGDNPDGWYCTNISDQKNIIWDISNSACFINPDKALQCLDPIPGNDAFNLQHSGEGVLVAVNGRTDFNVCGDRIFNTDKSGCRAVKLKASGLQGTCGNVMG